MQEVERVYHIHQWLRDARTAVSLKQMSEKLEVCERTIRRDFEFMRDRLGAPIEYDPTHKGWRYAPSGEEFELPGIWFNADELQALLSVSQLLDSLQPGLLHQQIQPLRRRISAMLEKSGHSQGRLEECILIKTSTPRTAGNDHFDRLAQAVLTGQPLHIHYHARATDEHKQRIVHPQRLLHYRDNWYLIAWCEQAQALRHFSVDRIRHPTAHPAPLHQCDPDQLNEHLQDGFGIFGGKARHQALLRFTPTSARWVADEIWHPRQQGRWSDNHYLLSLPYANPTELIMDILRHGSEVEVLEPPELRQEVAQRLSTAASRYAQHPQEKNCP